MNISKKAILSFIVALTSGGLMAQPYYHIMKEKNGKLTEMKVYDGKEYNIKIDMVKPENRPVGTIGGKITVPYSGRSFYFTKKGNVYYNSFTEKFGFEESQLDYPEFRYDMSHCGHFLWAEEIDQCIAPKAYITWSNATEQSFYFANPKNLPKLQEDLGNERWAVLSYYEWDYIVKNLGEFDWTVDGKNCYLIDTTPGKSLLTELKNNKSNKLMTKKEFESYESKGLVCLPASGYRTFWTLNWQNHYGYYWSCTPSILYRDDVGYFFFSLRSWPGVSSTSPSNKGYAVRLVVLAD